MIKNENYKNNIIALGDYVLEDFKIGDYVVGNQFNHYGVTNDSVICKIKDIDGFSLVLDVLFRSPNGIYVAQTFGDICYKYFFKLKDYVKAYGVDTYLKSHLDFQGQKVLDYIIDNKLLDVKTLSVDEMEKREYKAQKPKCKVCGEPIDFTTWKIQKHLDFCVCEKHRKYGEVNNIHNYHSSQTLKELKNDREVQLFGFELEVNTRERINRNLLNIYAGVVREILGEILYDIQEDGSVSNGFEIITNPMSKEYYFSKNTQYRLRTLLKFLNSVGLNYNNGCGLHIHTTRKPIEDLKIENYIGKLHLILETFKDEFKILSQRDSYSYCRFLSDEVNLSVEDLKASSLLDKKKNTTRYLTINNQKDATIELRLFKATTNIQILNAYMQIYMNIIDYLKKDKLDKKTIKDFTKGNYARPYANSMIKEYRELFIVDNSKIIERIKKIKTDKFNETIKEMLVIIENTREYILKDFYKSVDFESTYTLTRVNENILSIINTMGYVEDNIKENYYKYNEFRNQGLYRYIENIKIYSDKIESLIGIKFSYESLYNIYEELKKIEEMEVR